MIHLENITKEYDAPSGNAGSIVAARKLTLDVPAGEIFGLVGPNGAGKTTTLKMICGLIAPTAGRVTVNGIDVATQPEDAQQFIGYLADFFSLYDDLKVWEYLEYFARAYKMDRTAIPERVDQVIRQIGLESKRDSLIHGLSRGMKQRVGIGRAIIHDPLLLILDEPAAGLDPKARVDLKELLRDLHAKGKTIFITSHILSDLEEVCTSVAVIEKGQLLRVGRLEEVMRDGRAVRRIRIRLAAADESIGALLGARPDVTELASGTTGVEFSFSGDDARLAELVRELVSGGAPICGVQEISENLEQLYMRISSGEVS
ncbi:MAG: ABC transporter ATP-binding protein [Candidatus Acidiferrales bacterium]